MPATTVQSRPFGLKLRLPHLALNRETMTAALGSALLFGTVLGAAQGIAERALPTTPPPAPPSMAVRPLAPAQAVEVNKEIPIADVANPAAAAFLFKGGAETRAQAVDCLASAEYYEAGSQGADGERAVAQVVLNRVRHPAFPSSVCGVVYQGSTRATGCQFTFTCDGSLNRRPDAEGWKRAKEVAEAALSGAVYSPVGWATHYHADYVVPYWASTLAKTSVVGAHIFYRWNGGWGRSNAFVQDYSGHEANAAGLRNAALAAEIATAGQALTNVDRAIAVIPGAEVIKLAPSMRGDKRVAVRFNQTARKAADEAVHRDYSESFKASDNLRWTLSSETTSEAQAPLGKARPAPAAANGGGAASSLPQ